MKSIFWKVWGAPIVIGILSAFGLLSALIGDEVWDVLSWLTLGIPVAAMGFYLNKAGKKTGKATSKVR